MFSEIDWDLKPKINTHTLQKKKKKPCLMGEKYFAKNKLKKEKTVFAPLSKISWLFLHGSPDKFLFLCYFWYSLKIICYNEHILLTQSEEKTLFSFWGEDTIFCSISGLSTPGNYWNNCGETFIHLGNISVWENSVLPAKTGCILKVFLIQI